MAELPEKQLSLAELKQQLIAVLEELSVDNALLKAGRIIEQQPVAERIDRLAEIFLQLKARGKKVQLDVRDWDPKLLNELAINPKMEPTIRQIELKEKLLKKHGRRKLGMPKLRKRTRRRLPG